MSPIVSAMLEKVAGQDTELRLLEELFEHEAQCQSEHFLSDGSRFECSGDVVARKRVSCTSLNFLICTNSYRFNVRSITSGSNHCASCKKPTSECWTVTPI